jgi:transposase
MEVAKLVHSVPAIWIGVDVGKEFHWAHALDASGRKLFSHRVENDESDLLKLIDEVLSFTGEVLWAVDQPGGGAALLLALLWERAQRVVYIPGLAVERSRDTYRGESKTDARDAHVIAYPRHACGPTLVNSLLAKAILPSLSSCSLADATS